MAHYEIVTTAKWESFFSTYDQQFIQTIEADSDEEVLEHVRKNAIPGRDYKITRVERELVGTLTAKEIEISREKRRKEKEKEKRRELYNKLKTEFETTGV